MKISMPDRLKTVAVISRPHILSVLLLILATIAVYRQLPGHEFLSNWDDNKYVLDNPDVYGISWTHIQAVFTKYYSGTYAPVQMLSYMLDYTLWGLWSGGYLLTNLLIHILNGLLVYRLFLRLIGGRLAAFFGAAFFLIHPVQVESVAWISQRKNLLAMLFFLLAWEFYLAYRDGAASRRLYYAASLMALLLALLSKSVAVIFPVAVLLFDHCHPSTSGKIRYLDKIPYLLVAVAAAVLAMLSQIPDYSEWGAGGGRTGYYAGSATATLLTMLPVFCSYLRLIFWPVNLSALYDPEIHKSFDLPVLAALLFLGGILLLIYRSSRYDRRILFWPLFSIIAILPVSQIVPLVTLMNDRYLYFPMIGAAALTAYAVKFTCQQGRAHSVAFILLTVILLLMSVLSSQRVKIWRDAATLWDDAIKKSPNSFLAWEFRGEALHYSARPLLHEAIVAYRRAIELNPVNPAGDQSRYNLGVAYIGLNDYENADKILRELLQRSPVNVMGWTAFGDLSLRRFEYAEAENRYRKALSLQPEAVQVHQKIGNVMVVMGRIDEARSSYLRIEELQGKNDPLNAYELARVEALAGDTSASIRWLETAFQRGYLDFAAMMADEELTPVMSDGRFAILVNRYFPKQR